VSVQRAGQRVPAADAGAVGLGARSAHRAASRPGSDLRWPDCRHAPAHPKGRPPRRRPAFGLPPCRRRLAAPARLGTGRAPPVARHRVVGKGENGCQPNVQCPRNKVGTVVRHANRRPKPDDLTRTQAGRDPRLALCAASRSEVLAHQKPQRTAALSREISVVPTAVIGSASVTFSTR
jgi:hypothetical protein